MNRSLTLLPATLAVAVAATAVLLAAAPAHAQEATPDYPQAYTGSTTRAQVQAELAQARRDGSMRVWSTSYNHMTAAKSLKTRDQVQAELRADDGSMTALTGEDSGSFAIARRGVPAAAGSTLAAAR